MIKKILPKAKKFKMDERGRLYDEFNNIVKGQSTQVKETIASKPKDNKTLRTTTNDKRSVFYDP